MRDLPIVSGRSQSDLMSRRDVTESVTLWRVTCQGSFISVIAIVRNPSVILTFLISTLCYLVCVDKLVLGKYSGETMQSCVMCPCLWQDTKQGTREILGWNVWVIQFNKSDWNLLVMVYLYFAVVISTGLISQDHNNHSVCLRCSFYFYCLLMRTEFK